MKIRTIFAILGAVLGISFVGFMVFGFVESEEHMNNININGVTVSLRNLGQAQMLIEDKYSSDKTVAYIVGNDGAKHQYTMRELGVSLDLNKLSSDLVKIQAAQPKFYEPLMPKESNYTIEILYKLDLEKLRSVYNSDTILNPPYDEELVEPHDAFIAYDHNKSKYVVVKETYGNVFVNKSDDVFFEHIKSIVNQLDTLVGEDIIINITDIGMMNKPSLTEQNTNLKYNANILNEVLNYTLTLDIGGGDKEVVSPDTFLSWYTFNQVGVPEGETGNWGYKLNEVNPVTLNEELVRKYVQSLMNHLTTLGTSRKFTTNKGAVKTLQGNYGWWMNTEETFNNIMSALRGNQQNKSAVVAYRQTVAVHGREDWGNTYVEISLADQYLWYYRDGQCLLETPIISGNPNRGNATNVGIFSVTYKARNILVESVSTQYKLQYWMPFDENIGLHDATWQPSFPKDAYLYRGSHGCINMPLDKAKLLYSYIEQWDPVIVY